MSVDYGTNSELIAGQLLSALEAQRVWGTIMVNVMDFGARGNGVNDDTAAVNKAFLAAKEIGGMVIFPSTTKSYRLSKFNALPGVNVFGIGRPKIDLFYNNGGDPVLVGLKSDAVYENLHFNCLEPDLEWNRTDLTNQNNIFIRNCRFEGFRHTSGGPNAWGIYMDGTTNVVIENCQFENNSQSDIAIVEGCQNITIINAQGSALHLNIEPNDASALIKNIKVIGGTYNQVRLLENSFTSYCIQNASFTACQINILRYNGGGASFDSSCRIGTVENPVSAKIGGVVNFGGALSFSKNLLTDPLLVSYSNTGSSNWKLGYTPVGGMTSRINDAEIGRVFKLNPSNTNSTVSIDNATNVAVSENTLYAVVFTGRATYPVGSTFISYLVRVSYLDSGSTLISEEYLHFCRASAGNKSPLNTETCIFKTPANTAYLKVRITNASGQNSPASVDIVAISLHKVLSNGMTMNSSDDIKMIHTLRNGPLAVNAPEVPKPAVGYPAYEVGDKFTLIPANGVAIEYVCITAGSPGTWVASGQIGYRTSSGAPTVTPNFVGEELLDTTNGKWYKAKGATGSDWVALN